MRLREQQAEHRARVEARRAAAASAAAAQSSADADAAADNLLRRELRLHGALREGAQLEPFAFRARSQIARRRAARETSTQSRRLALSAPSAQSGTSLVHRLSIAHNTLGGARRAPTAALYLTNPAAAPTQRFGAQPDLADTLPRAFAPEEPAVGVAASSAAPTQPTASHATAALAEDFLGVLAVHAEASMPPLLGRSKPGSLITTKMRDAVSRRRAASRLVRTLPMYSLSLIHI